MPVKNIFDLPSAHYSPQHEITLRHIDELAKTHEIAISQKANVHGRTAYWEKVQHIALDAPAVTIVDKDGNFIRNVDLPTSIHDFLKETCSGCINTAIFFIDALANNLVFDNDIGSKQKLSNLQAHACFLRDILTAATAYKIRAKRHVTVLSQKPTRHKITLQLKKGEEIDVLRQKVRLNHIEPMFIFSNICLICYRLTETNSRYCNSHKSTRADEFSIKKNSAITARKRLFRRAYENLLLESHMDLAFYATDFDESDIASARKLYLKNNGYTRDDYFNSQCRTLMEWSIQHTEHRNFLEHLVVLQMKHEELLIEQKWCSGLAMLFNSIVRLTKQTKHMRYVFSSYFENTEPPKKLQNHLIDIFYINHEKQKTTKELGNLSPSDFISMLGYWSQIKLIENYAEYKPSI